jgi:hydroxypyruvate isomerase
MLSRRNLLKTVATAALTPAAIFQEIHASSEAMNELTNGKIRHSTCRWCYSTIPLDELCKKGKKIGLEALDLIAPADFDTVKKHKLDVSMVSPDGLKDYLQIGWNHTENHDTLVNFYTNLIETTAKAGFKNVIVFSGNRKGLNEEDGLKNCTEGLKKILPIAEKNKINLVMELLNSKVNHPDYQCDHTNWGVELCKMLSSERFSLLYDIYHMQIMEGDVIATIKKNIKYLSHFHTAGVPGRNEIDGNQELYYPAIMRAIAATGFKGYVAQEFIPTNTDKLASLKSAIALCDI